MRDEAEIFERLRDMELVQARHDERIKTVEDLMKEVKQIKLAAFGMLITIMVEIGLKFFK